MYQSKVMPTTQAGKTKDRFFRRNVIGISGVEFLWGLGLPVVVESTFLQLFLKHLGASSVVVGLIPFFFFIGTSVFALLSSYFTSDKEFKRTAVILLHFVSGFSLLLIGTSLLVFDHAAYVLAIFLGCYAVFSVCVGMTLPVWLNYLVKIFSEDKSVAGLAFMMIAQNVAKLIGSLVIVRIVDTYAFSQQSSALVFMAVGIVFIVGSLMFLVTREIKQTREPATLKRIGFWPYVATSARHITRNKNFLTFLAGDFELYIVITVISFYANYATTYCHVDPADAAGLFVACVYAGAIVTNVVLGTLGFFSLKHKYVISKMAAITAMLLLMTICNAWGFFLASFLLGLSRGTRMIVYAPAVKKLSGLADSTSYFAIGPILTLPFATVLPLAVGTFLDHFETLEADAYRFAFAGITLLLVATLVFILKTDFDPLPG